MKRFKSGGSIVGMVTIGQSPRTDVTSDVAEILGPSIKITECGALDSLTDEEIAELKPGFDDEILVSRLRDGTEVQLGHTQIVELTQRCIDGIEGRVDVVVLLCTGEFPELTSRRLIMKPSSIVSHLVGSLLSQGSLGVLVPSSDQLETTKSKWVRDGLSVIVESLSPYQEIDEAHVRRVAQKLKESGVDLVVLDCIGYTTELSEHFKTITGVPTLLPRTLVARMVREIL
ncbi:MAG: AroM family protein [Candidatus Hermodarchaeota archaeon]